MNVCTLFPTEALIIFFPYFILIKILCDNNLFSILTFRVGIKISVDLECPSSNVEAIIVD